MNRLALGLLLLVTAAVAALVGHAEAHRAAASLFQQQQHTRKLLQPSGTFQQFGFVSNDELLEQAVAELLASATQQQPQPPPAAASGSISAATAAAAAPAVVRRCGTKEDSSSERALAEKKFQARLQQLGYSDEVLPAGVRIASSNGTTTNTSTNITEIPVFFHIVQYRDPKNSSFVDGFISRTRLARQIVVLNRAYRGVFRFRIQQVQWYTTDSKSLFQAGQDSDSELRMKSMLRMQSVNSSSSSNSSTRSANSSSCSSLHVYTWAPLNQVLGWATFPHNFVVDPSKDGVVIAHTAIAGGTWENYNVGHTLTHEVGHWLGALHTFQGGCSASPTAGGDLVADTPAVRSPNMVCKPTDSCPSLPGEDLVNNFMDYAPDTCMTSFTDGQKARMTAQWIAFRADCLAS